MWTGMDAGTIFGWIVWSIVTAHIRSSVRPMWIYGLLVQMVEVCR